MKIMSRTVLVQRTLLAVIFIKVNMQMENDTKSEPIDFTMSHSMSLGIDRFLSISVSSLKWFRGKRTA